MIIEQNTLSLDKGDCLLIESELKKGREVKEVIQEQIKEMYNGDLNELEGIEIPSDYWHLVNELVKE
ncbi:hypothetical protein CVD28_00100 [Bacillus sp. M6-12]|uniref:hypothetical protein n=1 Tax=Bacillus sp. M6-12 TaxID=2054166 RepID=UPI000C75931A|nr:hypothetical protein [Bacillus sp. M6-12]PLS18838.1 hypothetical protein CVD28_00100 [Bacillus sp. M6-12]